MDLSPRERHSPRRLVATYIEFKPFAGICLYWANAPKLPVPHSKMACDKAQHHGSPGHLHPISSPIWNEDPESNFALLGSAGVADILYRRNRATSHRGVDYARERGKLQQWLLLFRRRFLCRVVYAGSTYALPPNVQNHQAGFFEWIDSRRNNTVPELTGTAHSKSLLWEETEMREKRSRSHIQANLGRKISASDGYLQ
ncbi:hypothetical protein B0H19DRAFT_1229651 [Mycena capillaripes]|nr:hypothetical protein B0H19DRAFT_1229651 [Mycena capillaripes]